MLVSMGARNVHVMYDAEQVRVAIYNGSLMSLTRARAHTHTHTHTHTHRHTHLQRHEVEC